MPILSPILGENTRVSIRTALREGSLRAGVLPVAATEQHNEHLAMHHDCRSVEVVTHRAALELLPSVVVCPTVSVGVSGHWMDHPGTLSVSPQTFVAFVFDVLDSLRTAGIQKILIVNGHGGNRRCLEEVLRSFNETLGIRVEFCSYWEAYSQEFIKEHVQTGECPGHASEFETSIALAEFPESVHSLPTLYPESEVTIRDPQRAADDRRFFSGVRFASAEKGRVYVDQAVHYLVSRLRVLVEE